MLHDEFFRYVKQQMYRRTGNGFNQSNIKVPNRLRTINNSLYSELASGSHREPLILYSLLIYKILILL